MSEASVSITLDTRKGSLRNDGKYPLKLRLTFKAKSRMLGLGKNMAVSDKDWNARKKEVRSSAKNSGHLKSKCDFKRSIALTVIQQLQSQLNQYEIDELKEVIKSALDRNTVEQEEEKKEVKPLIEVVDVLVERKESAKQWGSAEGYRSTLHSLLAFHVFKRMGIKKPDGFSTRKRKWIQWLREQGKSMLINVFTHELIKAYETFYFSFNDLKNGNGIMSRLRLIRVFLNAATRDGHIKSAQNPFSGIDGKDKYVIKRRTVKKRAMNPRIFYDFRKLYMLEEVNGVRLEEGSADWEAIAIMVFMWEANAMNFKDIVKLKIRDFSTEVLTINRSKTGGEIHVVKSELFNDIVAKFSKGKSPHDFLFKYGFTDTKKGHKKYSSCLNRWTERVRGVARKLKCYEEITSYKLRHTFATEMARNGVPRHEVGMMFGHISGDSIDTYVSQTDPIALANKKAAAEQLILKSMNQEPSSPHKEAA